MSIQRYTSSDWESRTDRYWTNFFNTLSGARSAVLIGTGEEGGVANLGLFNSLVHIGARPPLLGFILRPTTVPRHTYENLKRTGAYTVNHVHKDILDASHQCSAKYDKDISEFEACGLTEEYRQGLSAPFVLESPLKIGLEFREEHALLNGTRLIVGEVNSVLVKEEHIREDGSIDVASQELLTVSGLYRYHRLSFLTQKGYAQP